MARSALYNRIAAECDKTVMFWTVVRGRRKGLWVEYYTIAYNRGRGATGSRGQLTPTFSGAGSTYGAWPLTFSCSLLPNLYSFIHSFIHSFIQLFESLVTVSYSQSIVTMAVSLAISKTFSVKEWHDLEICFGGCSRALQMAPFDWPYDFLSVGHGN